MGGRVSKIRSRPKGSGRHLVLFLLFAAAFTAVAGRLVWVQAVAAPKYAEAALSQRLKDLELPARRGTIYDREGEPLAVSVDARTIYVAPNRIKDKEGTARALADTLGGDKDTYLAKLEKQSGFEYVARKVDRERAGALEDLELEGVGFIDDYRRLYPSGELACQVLGFVGVDGKGLEGLERQYDELLAGTPGVVWAERDPKGRLIPGGVQKEIDATHGSDIVLTIDKDIQYQTQVELTKAVKKWGAKSGSVVIMNPRTGEIYAMASTPTFNPNDYSKAKSNAVRNKPLVDAYEPGSTIKALTASAVIEEGYYTPDSMFNLPSTIKVGGRTIKEAHGRAAVRWSLTDIVTQSSNVGTVKLGMKLGAQGLYDSFSGFGLTEKTGVDFPGEATGWLPPPTQWSGSSIGNIPFGQGVSVTPLQLARSVAAIANRGELTTPHFLLDVPNGERAFKPQPARRAISEETAEAATEMLAAVVTEGTGKSAAVPGYAVAGKTGTAQKALPNGGGYRGGKYVGSFIGYLPAEDPQVLICVTIDEPTNAIYGGVVASPTFAKLAQFTVSHLKIPPSAAEVTKGTEGGADEADVKPVSDAEAD